MLRLKGPWRVRDQGGEALSFSLWSQKYALLYVMWGSRALSMRFKASFFLFFYFPTVLSSWLNTRTQSGCLFVGPGTGPSSGSYICPAVGFREEKRFWTTYCESAAAFASALIHWLLLFHVLFEELSLFKNNFICLFCSDIIFTLTLRCLQGLLNAAIWYFGFITLVNVSYFFFTSLFNVGLIIKMEHLV